MDIKKYEKYKKLIKRCKDKKYDKSLVLHQHHIIPKHLWVGGDGLNSKENLVELSVEDHIKAHLLLSECYEEGSYEHRSNLQSARILNSKSVLLKEDLEKISKVYEGEGNPFFGKRHTEETRKELSEYTKRQGIDIPYNERYGEKRAKEEKKKRSKGVKKYFDNLTDIESKKRSENISKSLKAKYVGSLNPYSKKIEIDGVEYGSINEACREFGMSRYYVLKMVKLIGE